MNRIEKCFYDLQQTDEKAMVGFVTAGDPTPDLSLEIILSMCESGLDILELGVPFSDPTADGPVIQRSSERALSNKVSLETVIAMTRSIREKTEIPVILFSYYNPIFTYGCERFYQDALSAGADGVLVVDLPPEESQELTKDWDNRKFCLIRLVAPTTPKDRMSLIANDATGFLYLVSMTGVTGSSGLDLNEVNRTTAILRSTTKLPICVGFGISRPQDAAAIAGVADGVVVGSAFEKLIEDNLEDPQLSERISDLVRSLKAATK